MKLTKRREFAKVSKYGFRRSGKWICVEILPRKEGPSRLGITVTRKYGPAHQRNRFKRLVREACRLITLPPADFIVRPRGNCGFLKMQDIQKDLIEIFHAKS